MFGELIAAYRAAIKMLFIDFYYEFIAEFHVLHYKHRRVLTGWQLFGILAEISEGERHAHIKRLFQCFYIY